MDFSNIPKAGKSLKVAPAEAPKAVKIPQVKAPPKARAGLDKSHNSDNQLSRQQGYSNGGMVMGKGKKGGC